MASRESERFILNHSWLCTNVLVLASMFVAQFVVAPLRLPWPQSAMPVLGCGAAAYVGLQLAYRALWRRFWRWVDAAVESDRVDAFADLTWALTYRSPDVEDVVSGAIEGWLSRFSDGSVAVGERELDALHSLLFVAGPDLFGAALDTLVAVGTRRSYGVLAEELGWQMTARMLGWAREDREEAHSAIKRARYHLAERLGLAPPPSGMLARPAGSASADSAALGRPAGSATEAAHLVQAAEPREQRLDNQRE